MLKFAVTTTFVLTASLFAAVPAQAHDLPTTMTDIAEASELENTILVPFQGTWVQGANTLIFMAGSSWNGNWIVGNVIGGGGQVNQYQWFQSTVTTGTFYFDTAQGRQGPVFVTLSNGNKRMTWQFGAESMVLNRVN